MNRQFGENAAGVGRKTSLKRQSSYASIAQQQRPQHQWDDFSIKHPKMSRAGRAKIFMPYDALKGYKEAVREKERLFENKRQLSGEETEKINTRLACLVNVCASRRATGQPPPSVSVRYFTEVPLSDEDILLGADPCAVRGYYLNVTGIVRKISQFEKYLIVDGKKIAFDSIADINGSLFDEISAVFAE